MVHGETFKHVANKRYVKREHLEFLTEDPSNPAQEGKRESGPGAQPQPYIKEEYAELYGIVSKKCNADDNAGAGASSLPMIPLKDRKVEVVWEKMSKSKGNGIEPDQIVTTYGADVSRLFALFKAPPERVLNWDERTVLGKQRWVHRLWTLVRAFIAANDKSFVNGSGTRPPLLSGGFLDTHMHMDGKSTRIVSPMLRRYAASLLTRYYY